MPEDHRDTIALWCARRVPARMRDQVQFGFTERAGRVTIVERRPPVYPELDLEWTSKPVAQLRFAEHGWTLYWADRNGRWHRYPHVAPSATPVPLLAEVDRDPTGIFWG